MHEDQTRAPVQIHTEESEAWGANRTFARDFSIGRGTDCDVRIQSGLVSRVHAKVIYEEGRWWVCDNDSTNGTYLDGEHIDRMPLPAEATLQLGQNGPAFHLTIQGATQDEAEVTQIEGAASQGTSTIAEPGEQSANTSSAASRSPAERPSKGRPDPSVTQYIEHYFNNQDRPAGEHTRMLRQAYQRVQTKQKRKYTWVIAGVLVLCVLLGGYAIVQHIRNEQLGQTAEQVFIGLKELDVQIAQFRRKIEESGNASLAEQLQTLEKNRQQMQARYAGFVEELGLYRELTPKEREIYRVARIFRESEFSIPAGFVRRVKATIENYWLQEPYRSDYVDAIQRAEQNGYTPYIVKTMQEHGLPPEFFYLALQESRFQTDEVGPRTNYGIAKGMWQFIPGTARQYGLRLGPRADMRVYDPQDERHDFKKSTEAAARYLQTIYSTKAQASGLLVIASYNWGEHRVVNKLERIPSRPQSIPQEALEGIPENPEKRNYWRFLNEYSNRMPEQTKDYVLKIFSAAVIGQDPRLFGFTFDNPLQKYIEASAEPKARS